MLPKLLASMLSNLSQTGRLKEHLTIPNTDILLECSCISVLIWFGMNKNIDTLASEKCEFRVLLALTNGAIWFCICIEIDEFGNMADFWKQKDILPKGKMKDKK